MSKYKDFHRLKKDVALKLLSIEDGDRLKGVPDDFLATGTNLDVLNECFEMMQQAKKLADELAKNEELE